MSSNARHEIDALRRRVRLIALLEAAECAGLAPISVMRLHTFAYLSNVLAPVWDMPALEGKVLKKQGGPFYPALQHDLDRLVGMGVASITHLGHIEDEEGRTRVEGTYRLNRIFADRILELLRKFPEEAILVAFVEELAFALSSLSDEDIDRAMTEDATYSDPLVDVDNVVDFAEWRDVNYSANAARRFRNLLPGGSVATPGEKLHLYVRHLHRRIYGG